MSIYIVPPPYLWVPCLQIQSSNKDWLNLRNVEPMDMEDQLYYNIYKMHLNTRRFGTCMAFWNQSPIERLLYFIYPFIYQWTFRLFYALASLVVQMVKNLPAIWETWVQSLV